jgi:hypothetical protein
VSNHAPLRRSSHLTTLLTTGIAERRWYIINEYAAQVVRYWQGKTWTHTINTRFPTYMHNVFSGTFRPSKRPHSGSNYWCVLTSIWFNYVHTFLTSIRNWFRNHTSLASIRNSLVSESHFPRQYSKLWFRNHTSLASNRNSGFGITNH